MKALVLGATGAVGKDLVQQLLADDSFVDNTQKDNKKTLVLRIMSRWCKGRRSGWSVCRGFRISMSRNNCWSLAGTISALRWWGKGRCFPGSRIPKTSDSRGRIRPVILQPKASGWKPYHVRKGFDLNDNTITLGSTLLWGNNMAPSTTHPQKVMELLAWDISERSQFALGSGRLHFAETPSFSKFFSRLKGLSPRAYRES